MRKPIIFLALLCSFSLFYSFCNGQSATLSTYAVLPDTAYSGGIAFDASGNLFYADQNNNVVKKITPAGIITTVVGTGVAGFSGDGGPATAAKLYTPGDVMFDASGNMYITDYNNNRVRKVSSSGIITTIAGDGAFVNAGDGGPATAASMVLPESMAMDSAGNIYILSFGTPAIRKINTAGIISTIADSSGLASFSGDGGPAISATMYSVGMAIDAGQNVYIADAYNNRIRKIDASGTITTIAGTGTAGYSGDGGPAALAELFHPWFIKTDLAGNIFFGDNNSAIRKIDPYGIITTVVSGVASPMGLTFDASHNLYVASGDSSKIYEVAYASVVSADSFSVYLEQLCNGISLTAYTSDPAANTLYTYFGDGTIDTSAISGTPGHGYDVVYHNYAGPGVYTIKEFLKNGTSVVDSGHFTYEYQLCRSLTVKFYNDGNGNCTKDAGETYNFLPIATEIDSNGVAIDTISATSGFYYAAYGTVGDVYSFRIISAPPGLTSVCMPGGIVYDTLGTLPNDINYIGLSCTSSSGFDLGEYADMVAGRHMASGNIIAYNNYCTPENATVTLNIDPKYSFESAAPAPSSVTGGTVTWNFPSMAANTFEQNIHFTLTTTGTTLTAGDTILSAFSISPLSGDLDASNNNCVIIDTVKASYDPNEMEVSPSGYILAGTKLRYTINFENTGNDTAFNIYVLDTLSDNVEASSLHVLAASGVMNTSASRYGSHNIVRFDLPGINLLDSSHHNLCDGMLQFTVNAKSGLPDGTTIFNHAGIFFDDNPVVRTNTVEDIIGIPATTHSALLNRASDLQIYPSPATDVLTIKMEPGAYSSFTIRNSIGQEMIQRPLAQALTKVSIDILPAGVYYITLKGDNGIKTQKFIKQ